MLRIILYIRSMNKICTKCDLEKSLEDFSNKKKSKDGKSTICLKCTREYTKKHYNDNKSYYIEKAKKAKKVFEDWFNNYKQNLFCKNCGESRSWVLDFHHRDPKEKDNNISTLLKRGNKKIILDEVKKCDVLCSNCHRDFRYKKKLKINLV